jgi:hypothetical protein
MPDTWELQYDLDPQNAGGASLDVDSDGLTNYAEYLSGTDRRDPHSALRFDQVSVSYGTLQLSFTAQASRSYTVQFRNDMGTQG